MNKSIKSVKLPENGIAILKIYLCHFNFTNQYLIINQDWDLSRLIYSLRKTMKNTTLSHTKFGCCQLSDDRLCHHASPTVRHR